jgi:hypothetical protein
VVIFRTRKLPKICRSFIAEQRKFHTTNSSRKIFYVLNFRIAMITTSLRRRGRVSVKTPGHLLGDNDKDFGRCSAFIDTPKSFGEVCRDNCSESVFRNRSIFLGVLDFGSLSKGSLNAPCRLGDVLETEGR